jgi:hypothetical protein
MNGKEHNDFVKSCWPQFPVASGDGRLFFLIQLLCGWLTGVMSAVGFRKLKTARRVLLEEEKIACIFIGPGCIEGVLII